MCFNIHSYLSLHPRAILSTGATVAAALVNSGQQVHAPVNFQALNYIQTFLSGFYC